MNQTPNEQTPPKASDAPSMQKPAGFLKRVVRYFVGLACLGGIVLLCLPWIASTLISEQAAEQWLSDSISGDIKIGDASIGWNSPVMLNDVTYSDKQGKKLLDVKAVTSNQSLWDLLRRPNRPIELEFEGMQASFIVPRLEKRDTSAESIDLNVVLQKLLNLEVPLVQRDISIRVVNSQLELTDPEGKLLNRWTPVSGEYHSKASSQHEQTLNVVAPVASVSQNSVDQTESIENTKIDIKWNKPLSTKVAEPETLAIHINCVQQPLAMLQPLLENHLPELLPLDPATGQFSGSIERSGQSEMRVKLQTEQAPFQQVSFQTAAPPMLPLKLNLDAHYSQDADRINVSQLYAQLDETSLVATGEVTEVSGKQVVDAHGKFQSPAAGLSKLLPEEIKDNVEFKDIQMSDIAMKGPLRPDPQKPFNFVFELSTTVSWTHATAYGLQSENGKVKLTMRGNQLILMPIDLPINNGKVLTLPTLDLSTKPVSVSLTKGLMLDRINLTEQICSDWLKYVSPLLSDATRPSGTFSLHTEAGQFQLEHMDSAKLSGHLLIHRAEVRPGPLADELLNMVSAIRLLKNRELNSDNILLLKMNDQLVEYQVVDGRVYHAGFQFQVGDFTFASNGSVGFDETLDIVITMSFPKEIAERGPILQSLTNQPLEFHLTGTIDKPKIKGAELKEMGKRIGIQAAEGLLQKLLENRAKKTPRRNRNR